MTNVCPERMLSKASVCMGKGCSLCVVMPMMCDSNAASGIYMGGWWSGFVLGGP